jgi:hypothetical protein
VLVPQAHKVMLDLPVYKVLLAQLAHKVRRVYKALPAHKAHRA